MNCTSTLELLDCVRPNSADLELPEFVEARAHLEQCEECRVEFARRQKWDAAITQVMHQVDVPQDQPAKLLAVLDATNLSANVAATDASKPARRFRHGRMAALAMCLALLVAYVCWPRNSDKLSIGEVLARVSVDFSRLSTFDGRFSLSRPLDWSHITLQDKSFGQDLDGLPGDEVALRLFRYEARRGHVIQGVLLTMSADRVSPPPASDRFLEASPRYPSIGDQRFVAVAWQESGRVFICLIPDHPGDLELLQRAAHSSAA